MALTVNTREIDGITVLGFVGEADTELIVDIVSGIEAVAGDRRCVVLDVDSLWLVDVAAVRAFVTRLLEGSALGHVVFSCGRVSGRRILRRWSGDELPVFSSAADGAAACRERHLLRLSATG
jgi:hypothetical protein